MKHFAFPMFMTVLYAVFCVLSCQPAPAPAQPEPVKKVCRLWEVKHGRHNTSRQFDWCHAQVGTIYCGFGESGKSAIFTGDVYASKKKCP